MDQGEVPSYYSTLNILINTLPTKDQNLFCRQDGHEQPWVDDEDGQEGEDRDDVCARDRVCEQGGHRDDHVHLADWTLQQSRSGLFFQSNFSEGRSLSQLMYSFPNLFVNKFIANTWKYLTYYISKK